MIGRENENEEEKWKQRKISCLTSLATHITFFFNQNCIYIYIYIDAVPHTLKWAQMKVKFGHDKTCNSVFFLLLLAFLHLNHCFCNAWWCIGDTVNGTVKQINCGFLKMRNVLKWLWCLYNSQNTIHYMPLCIEDGPVDLPSLLIYNEKREKNNNKRKTKIKTLTFLCADCSAQVSQNLILNGIDHYARQSGAQFKIIANQFYWIEGSYTHNHLLFNVIFQL